MTRAINRICALLSHRSPWRIVYCAEAARRLHEQAFGYDRKRGVVVENGVDFRAFAFDPARRAALRAAWGLGPEALLPNVEVVQNGLPEIVERTLMGWVHLRP